MSRLEHFDVAVVGAGPVGSVAALAHALQGVRVILLESNSKLPKRLAGEWLHPSAYKTLLKIGIDLEVVIPSHRKAAGFVVFPDDGSESCLLPYPEGYSAFICDSRALIQTLRDAAITQQNICYVPDAKVKTIDGKTLFIQKRNQSAIHRVSADRIIGADGHNSTIRNTLSHDNGYQLNSYLTSLLLEEVELPYEGYGHVWLGGPGPVLGYRVAPNLIRMILDVPLCYKNSSRRAVFLWDNYASIISSNLRPAFRMALSSKRLFGAPNQVRLRRFYGQENILLVGDAVGHYHPLTAVGMTLGFSDAFCAAQSRTHNEYEFDRLKATRIPEIISIGLYEAFTHQTEEAAVTRRAIYTLWRNSFEARLSTMRFLSCEDTTLLRFVQTFLSVTRRSLIDIINHTLHKSERGRFIKLTKKLIGDHLRWLTRMNSLYPITAELTAKSNDICRESDRKEVKRQSDIDAKPALQASVKMLIDKQLENGAWEGEVVWAAVLPAQYVLMQHILGLPIPSNRRETLLRQFHQTRQANGLWGLHLHSRPYLFTTTLVYVAARLLGVLPNDSLLAPAAEFIRKEGGVKNIPSWGKFWLAMLNLYDWEGLNPLLPEAWLLPKWLPFNPDNFYCHTRLIYMAMAIIYSSRYQVPRTSIIDSLHSELYPPDHNKINVRNYRSALRTDDLFTKPGLILRALYYLMDVFERFHNRPLRRRVVDKLMKRIEWELRITDHTSISPVTGLLNIIALWIYTPQSAELQRALTQFDVWIWEDEKRGTRVAGARSASWDTAFVIQALSEAAPFVEARRAFEKGISFLLAQQIPESFEGYLENGRLDPKGGWCVAGVWHGWPVSDCTAEAILALLEAPVQTIKDDVFIQGVEFILRCQNSDGGFGSYENSGSYFSLEYLNPAEMFGDSMTDHSWVECTASCIAALANFRKRFPNILSKTIEIAINRATKWLIYSQQFDGAWNGAWGVYQIYGSMFGVRGLLAGGIPVYHPAIRKVCRWLLHNQRQDGGWGESHIGCLSGKYIALEQSHYTQTAWALLTLLEAQEPDWLAIERGAHFLVNGQNESGDWPQQQMVGIFFRTALLDYDYYRQYFPLWALSKYEKRRQDRLEFIIS